MNMPGIGSQFFQLPSNIRRAVEAGQPMFELQLTEPFNNTQKLWGLWNVHCHERIRPGTTRISYQFEWMRGNDAYVEFKPGSEKQGGRNGICVGFAPDDSFFHNRVMLAGRMHDNKEFVRRLHTAEGTIPKQTVLEYLKCTWDVCFEWHIVKKGPERRPIVIERFSGLKEASARLSDIHSEIPEENSIERNKIWIIQGKTKPVEEIIAKHRGFWTQSDEFRLEVIPRIKDLIKQRTAGMAKNTDMAELLIDAANKMSPDQKKKLAVALLGGHDIAAVTALEPEQDKEIDLDKANAGEIRAIAKAKGIVIRGKTHKALVAEIREKVAEEKAALKLKAEGSERQQNSVTDSDDPLPSYEQFAEDEEEELEAV